jgi:excisionase family DNA binding protein
LVAFGAFIVHILSMTATRTSERRKGRKAIASHGGDRVAVMRLAGMLKAVGGAKSRHAVQIIDESGKHVELPDSLADVMARAAMLLAEGRSVSVVADDEMLTTQGAAELLNVSRQYVVRLVDQGTLPAVRVGSHRRLRAREVEAYKVQRDSDRDAALDRLAQASEEMGGYGLSR